MRMKVVGSHSKREILQRAKTLSLSTFERVFIAPDLTKKQQEEDKDLRDRQRTIQRSKRSGSHDQDKSCQSCKKRDGKTGSSPLRSQEGSVEQLDMSKCKKILRINYREKVKTRFQCFYTNMQSTFSKNKREELLMYITWA